MSKPKKRRHEGRVVRKEILIDAEPQQVWEAWADPAKLATWFVDRADGETRPGEVMTWHFDTFDYHVPVNVYEVEEGRRLVIGGERPEGPPALQEILIEKRGGSTLLRLANSGFGEGAEWDDEYEGVDSGWEMALATLKHWLERYPARARTHVLRMRPAALEYARLLPLYTTAAGLASWLGEEVSLGSDPLTVGTELRLSGLEGGPWSGSVLARTTREVLLSWREESAVVGLKAFALGPGQRFVALDFNAWPLEGRGAGETVGLEGLLDAALDRLLTALDAGSSHP